MMVLRSSSNQVRCRRRRLRPGPAVRHQPQVRQRQLRPPGWHQRRQAAMVRPNGRLLHTQIGFLLLSDGIKTSVIQLLFHNFPASQIGNPLDTVESLRITKLRLAR